MDSQYETIRRRPGMNNAIAKACGVTPQTVSGWARVPPHHVLTVAELTGLHPHILAPGIYPADMDWAKGEALCK